MRRELKKYTFKAAYFDGNRGPLLKILVAVLVQVGHTLSKDLVVQIFANVEQKPVDILPCTQTFANGDRISNIITIITVPLTSACSTCQREKV